MSVFQNVKIIYSDRFFFYDREAIFVFYGNQKRIYLFLLERRKITWKGGKPGPPTAGPLIAESSITLDT